MPSLKAIRTRITSVKNTRKITRAMKLVSTAKLRRAQDALTQARPYTAAISRVVSELAAVAGTDSHKLFEERPLHKAAIVVMTSDRGQAGAFNANVTKAVEKYAANELSSAQEVSLRIIGRKGNQYFSRRRATITSFDQAPTGLTALDVAREVKLAHVRQDHAQRVLGHRRRVDAAAVREHDVALDHLREEQRAHARGGDLNPAQPRCRGEVGRRHREAEDHLGLRQQPARLRLIGRRQELEIGELAAQPGDVRWRQVPDAVGGADVLEHAKRPHGGAWCHRAPVARERQGSRPGFVAWLAVSGADGRARAGGFRAGERGPERHRAATAARADRVAQ